MVITITNTTIGPKLEVLKSAHTGSCTTNWQSLIVRELSSVTFTQYREGLCILNQNHRCKHCQATGETELCHRVLIVGRYQLVGIHCKRGN